MFSSFLQVLGPLGSWFVEYWQNNFGNSVGCLVAFVFFPCLLKIVDTSKERRRQNLPMDVANVSSTSPIFVNVTTNDKITTQARSDNQLPDLRKNTR